MEQKEILVKMQPEEIAQLQLCITCRLGFVSSMYSCATSAEEQNKLSNEQALLVQQAQKFASLLSNVEDNN